MKNSEFLNYMVATGKLEDDVNKYFKIYKGNIDNADINIGTLFKELKNKKVEDKQALIIIGNLMINGVKSSLLEYILDYVVFIFELIHIDNNRKYILDEIMKLYKSPNKHKLRNMNYRLIHGNQFWIDGRLCIVMQGNFKGMHRIDLVTNSGITKYHDVIGIEKDLITNEVSVIKRKATNKLDNESIKTEENKVKLIFDKAVLN